MGETEGIGRSQEVNAVQSGEWPGASIWLARSARAGVMRVLKPYPLLIKEVPGSSLLYRRRSVFFWGTGPGVSPVLPEVKKNKKKKTA